MHISLDGFVAGPKGEMDWIKIDEEVFDYVGKRISKGDSALYGRITYEMMENYWPNAGDKPNATKHDIEHSRWYNKVKKFVLSNTMKNEGSNNTVIISNIPEGINEIRNQEGDEILLFGSPTTAHSLMKLKLIDGYWLFVNPVILGRGIPLFTDVKEKIDLKLLTTTRQFTCGVTELNYLTANHQ